MIALDLFAGTGWGVACQRLGIEEHGVEIMPEAVQSRMRNGMTTAYLDVWEGLEIPPDVIEAYENVPSMGPKFGHYDTLIASPPCQTFSMAGSGAGRKALDDVLEAIDSLAYRDPAALRAFGEKHDPRTALVLTPLAHVYRDTPTYVVFEQVPPVLPVWERCAEEMRRWGYSVWTGNLQAEMYGVPQTRKRAVLIARADGIVAAPPTPTHNRYNPRAEDGGRNADPTLLPWVSMAEALGWGMTGGGSGAKAAINRGKSAGRYISNQYTSTTGENYERDAEAPAPSITGGSRSARIMRGAGNSPKAGGGRQGFRREGEPGHTVTGGGSAAWGMTDRPYPTVAVGVERGGGTDPLAVGGSGARKIIYDARERGDWVDERPATTVSGDPRIAAAGHHERQMNNAERVTVDEAAALQSYPRGFVFAGTKTKQFLQVGNAVPPLLAEAILKGFLS